MSHWFDGASNLKYLYSSEYIFHDEETQQLVVSGQDIFAGCTNLLGGNGSSISTIQSTGDEGLYDDCYLINPGTDPMTYTPHRGLITDYRYAVNIIYDYNYETEDLPELDRQNVSYNKAFTVGGEDNNCGPIPSRPGYAFKG